MYNLNFGYLNNVNRYILAFHETYKKRKVEDLFHWNTMGESIYVL